MVDTVYVNKNGGVRKRRLASPSSGTFLLQHTWDPRHAQNGRCCARRCLGRKRLCLIHYVCLCVSFVSAEHLNIISIGPTRFVSNVKTACVTSSPVVSQPMASKRLAQRQSGCLRLTAAPCMWPLWPFGHSRVNLNMKHLAVGHIGMVTPVSTNTGSPIPEARDPTSHTTAPQPHGFGGLARVLGTL